MTKPASGQNIYHAFCQPQQLSDHLFQLIRILLKNFCAKIKLSQLEKQQYKSTVRVLEEVKNALGMAALKNWKPYLEDYYVKNVTQL